MTAQHVELVKALAWPGLVVALVIIFWSPLHKTASAIPGVLERSEAISIGEVALKVRRDLGQEVTPEVKSVLARLSKSGVGQLLRLKDTLWAEAPDEKDVRRSLSELEGLGLVSEVTAQELAQHNSENHGYSYVYGVRTTELGKKTRDFLRAVVSELAREVGGQSKDGDS